MIESERKELTSIQTTRLQTAVGEKKKKTHFLQAEQELLGKQVEMPITQKL